MKANPDYIYLTAYYDILVSKRAPRLREWLDVNCQLFSTDSLEGGWYQHNQGARPLSR